MNKKLKELGCAVVLESIKEFFEEVDNVYKQRKIIRELCSEWMDWLSDGYSLMVARELKNNPAKVYQNYIKNDGRAS